MYPAVHRAYEEKVPLELSEEQFWRKYLESEYFVKHYDIDTNATLAKVEGVKLVMQDNIQAALDGCAQLDNIETQSDLLMNQGRPLLNLLDEL